MNRGSKLLIPMEKKKLQSGQKGGRKALGWRGRPRRGPVFTLTREQVIQRCQNKQRAPICAGQVLAVMELMVERQWNVGMLAQKSGVSLTHLSDFLAVKKFFSTHYIAQVARAFGLELWELDQLAENQLRR